MMIVGIVLLVILVVIEGMVIVSRNQAIAALQQQQKEYSAQAVLLQDQLKDKELDLARMQAYLDTANARVEDRERLNEKWEAEFKKLASEALANNTENFLTAARHSFENLTTQAAQKWDTIIKPTTEVLDKFEKRVQEIEKDRNTAYTHLITQIDHINKANQMLSEETAHLCNALRKPDVRGQWGEMQLRRTVELAGMLPHVDFDEQVSSSSDTQGIRPDMIIHLPNDRSIIVDSKAPLTGYLEAMAAESKTEQQLFLENFSKQVRKHIEKLSGKSYWEQFRNSPEFVILFLPGENFLGDALRGDAGLLEYGVSKKVILATPTTLIALLQAISYGWKQEKLANEAKEIADAAHLLYDRLGVLFKHFSDVGLHLNKAVESFNGMRASAEARVIPQVKRLQSMGIGSKEVKPVERIESVANSDPLLIS